MKRRHANTHHNSSFKDVSKCKCPHTISYLQSSMLLLNVVKVNRRMLSDIIDVLSARKECSLNINFDTPKIHISYPSPSVPKQTMSFVTIMKLRTRRFHDRNYIGNPNMLKKCSNNLSKSEFSNYFIGNMNVISSKTVSSIVKAHL